MNESTATPRSIDQAQLLDFVRAIYAAKVGSARVYAALATQMPSVEGRLGVERVAADEMEHAAALARLTGGAPLDQFRPAVAPGCGLNDETWPSALLSAFALDQAATAALLAFTTLQDNPIAGIARRITDEERAHQAFAIGAFKSVADRDPTAGRRLAADMLVTRDWVKQVFPRHAILVELAGAGLLPSDAAKMHDSFLASLGDRIQEALGVLGD